LYENIIQAALALFRVLAILFWAKVKYETDFAV
jgi:hypothetical protein